MAPKIRVCLFYVLLSKVDQSTKHLKKKNVGNTGIGQPKCELRNEVGAKIITMF